MLREVQALVGLRTSELAEADPRDPPEGEAADEYTILMAEELTRAALGHYQYRLSLLYQAQIGRGDVEPLEEALELAEVVLRGTREQLRALWNVAGVRLEPGPAGEGRRIARAEPPPR